MWLYAKVRPVAKVRMLEMMECGCGEPHICGSGRLENRSTG